MTSRSEIATAIELTASRLGIHRALASEIVAGLNRPSDLIRHLTDDGLQELARAVLHGDARLFKEDPDD